MTPSPGESSHYKRRVWVLKVSQEYYCLSKNLTNSMHVPYEHHMPTQERMTETYRKVMSRYRILVLRWALKTESSQSPGSHLNSKNVHSTIKLRSRKLFKM